MNNELKILILGDDASPVDLIDYELSKLSLRCTSLHVTSREAFLVALQEFSPDFILVSPRNSELGSLTALALAQEISPGVPFFCVDFSSQAEAARQNPPARAACPRPGLSQACTPPGHDDGLQPFLQISGVVIAFLSPEGRILEFNHGAERLTGWLRHEVLGKDGIEVFFPEAARAEAADQLQRVLSGEAAEGIQLPLKVRHGRARACRWYCNLISDRLGQPAGIMLVGQYLAEPEPWESRPRAGLARANPQPGTGRGCSTRRTGTC